MRTRSDTKLITSTGIYEYEFVYKIVDFGCAYIRNNKPSVVPQARSFRAPEVILDLPYDYESDMWSLACTLVHIATGRRVVKGNTDEEVLTSMIKVLGVPPQCMILASPVAKLFFVDGIPISFMREQKQKKSKREKRSKKQKQSTPCVDYFDDLVIQGYNVMFVNFLDSCLLYEPEYRMTPDEALEHPWITEEY